MIFGPYGISYRNPPLQAPVEVLGIQLTQAEILTVAGALALLGLLAVLAARTRLGLAWRATVTDPQMAESFGVDILRVRYVNFFIGSALAAAAGVMVALLNNLVEPTMGSVPSYKALAIIVLGGLGSVPGTLLAARPRSGHRCCPAPVLARTARARARQLPLTPCRRRDIPRAAGC